MYESQHFLRAYDEIKTCRPINGFGFCSIPFTAIDAWASRNGWDDPDDFDFLRRAIRLLDDCERELVEKRTAETAPPANPSA